MVADLAGKRLTEQRKETSLPPRQHVAHLADQHTRDLASPAETPLQAEKGLDAFMTIALPCIQQFFIRSCPEHLGRCHALGICACAKATSN